MPTCPFCHKTISDDEYVVNWASCSQCFSDSYDRYLEEQKNMALDPRIIEEEKEKEEIAESHEGEESDEDDEDDEDEDDEDEVE